MKVSLRTIKQYIPVDLPPVDELVERINQQLGSVDAVVDLGARYKGVVVVRVVACEPLENSDHLHKCLVDDGGVTADVERDASGYVQVLTGAPNVHKDMLAVWLPPKTIVPETFATEPFVLTSRPMRGAMSHGMLASSRELAIGSAHEGIIDITDETSEAGATPKPGDAFADVFGLNDTIIDIENKMFTHRPDCFGQLGVAREISAILQGVTSESDGVIDTRYENADWYWQVPEFTSAAGLQLEVFNDAPEKSPRFMAVAMDGVTIKPSPLWLQCALVRMGGKPINNVVDVTNYIMFMTAQPTHAYDYTKIRGAKLGVRMANDGEKIHLLNDKTYELEASDIVIADGEGPIGLAGIMGGGDSEVDEHTTSIVLEVANFDMYTVRKSSMRHGLFTDALTRFNKGQSPLQNDRILARLMQLMGDFADAKQASDVMDVPSFDGDKTSLSGEVVVDTAFINERLGSSLTTEQIGNLLRRVNIASYPKDEGDKDHIVYVAPFWRTDIELPEDIVEEVGRLYGFDKLPRELPVRSIKPASLNKERALKAAIRSKLSRAGANEVLSYSFVHGDLLAKAGQDPAHAYQLGNALSPDLQYYRLSLMPSLLAKVHPNSKAGYSQLALFELGKAHIVGEVDSDKLPREDELVGLVVAIADKQKPSGSAYYHAKRYLEELVPARVSYTPLPEAMLTYDITKPYDPKRSAAAYIGETFIGIIGEFKSQVRKALKLPEYCAGFELDTHALLPFIGMPTYQPLSRFPSTSQDISLKAAATVSYNELLETVTASLDEQANGLYITTEPVSIYQAETEPDTKTTTFHITFTSYDRTLTDDDVTPHMEYVAKRAQTKLGAERI